MLVRSSFLVAGTPGSGGATTLNAAFGVGSYPGDGGGYVRIVWSVNNPVGGEYVDIVGVVSAGDPITGIGIPDGYFADPAAMTSPTDLNVPLGANAEASAQVDLYDASDNLLDTVILSSQLLPT